MNPLEEEPAKDHRQYAFKLTLAAVIGQVGCLTSVIILVALFGGLWLDSQFGTKPKITIGLILISIPITLLVMVWIVRTATNKIALKGEKNPQQFLEEEHIRE